MKRKVVTMGGGGAGYHSSRAEFLSDDTLNDNLKYSRNGGCFVTTKKAIAFVIFAVLSLLFVAMLMYYYGPNQKIQTVSSDLGLGSFCMRSRFLTPYYITK